MTAQSGQCATLDAMDNETTRAAEQRRDDKAVALLAVGKAARALDAAQAKAAERLADRDRAILAAQAAGATYPELASAAGLTRDRIRQVLSALRRTTDPTE